MGAMSAVSRDLLAAPRPADRELAKDALAVDLFAAQDPTCRRLFAAVAITFGDQDAASEAWKKRILAAVRPER
jgi:hypothetical protein